MVNDLLHNWHLRIKICVDNTTVLEILPRNGVSLLNHAVSEIHHDQFSSEHDMISEPQKVQENTCEFHTQSHLISV